MLDLILAAGLACLPTPDAHSQLAQEYGENRVMAGLSTSGAIIEMWASSEGTWTVLMSMPDGMSCIMDAGQGFLSFPFEAEGEPA